MTRLTKEREAEIREEIGAVHAYLARELFEEIDALRAERDALWQLLDDIDTLDDACRNHDSMFRLRAYAIQQKRWNVYNPDTGKSPPNLKPIEKKENDNGS